MGILKYKAELKRLVILLILGMIIYPSVIHVFILKVAQYKVKVENQSNLSENNSKAVLIQIDLENDSHQFEWIDNKEFLYRSEMYDLIKKEKKGNTLYLYAIKDTKELKLIKQLKAIVFDDLIKTLYSRGSSKVKIVIKQIFKKYTYFQQFDSKALSAIDSLERKKLFHFLSLYESISIDKLSPPPKGMFL